MLGIVLSFDLKSNKTCCIAACRSRSLIFFTESFKSEIIIRQSIGRGLRLHKEKDVLSIVDFVDNFCYDGWKNYLYKHGDARQKIYKEQKFPYDVKKVNF